MTCIVGLVSHGAIWMGADSAGVAGLALARRKDPKVFRNGPMVMAMTSSFRLGNLLRYKLQVPSHPPKMAVHQYMCDLFISNLRQCLKDGGYAEKNNEVEKGGIFLVGYRNQLFHVESDYQVGQRVEPFDAHGCGQDLALGSLYSTRKTLKDQPRDRMVLALQAAAQFSAGVRPPFNIEVLQ